jgi:hypothetical protein
VIDYEYWAIRFSREADEANDAEDHDELHAAGEVCRLMSHMGYQNNYVQRWLEGLTRRVGERYDAH